MLYLVARNPASQNALYMDIKNGLNDHGTVTEENLQRMQYAKACLRETFRWVTIIKKTMWIEVGYCKEMDKQMVFSKMGKFKIKYENVEAKK